MGITLTGTYLAELEKGVNKPNVIVEITLDGGTYKFGYHDGGFSDVTPVLKSVSSLQNKLDLSKSLTTRGQISVTITGRDNFKTLIRDEYLKNRRVRRLDGFVSNGFLYSDYAETFSGKITSWSRKGDELTITVADELKEAKKKIPVEKENKTQLIDYRSWNPVDIVKDIITVQLGINTNTDIQKFTDERDDWLAGWLFDRVITEPKEANKYLSELQTEMNAFVFHDGKNISFKVPAPPPPGTLIDEWSDGKNIIDGTLGVGSGYGENFFNRIVVYYDYDESGSDGAENFEAAVIAVAADSQDPTQWDEIKSKTVKSKWIRSNRYTKTNNITGVTIYHLSASNGLGNGTLNFTAASKTLSWTAPGGSAGQSVELSKDGKHKVKGADENKFIRVVVDTTLLPLLDNTDTINITALDGRKFATMLATKLLGLYRNPTASVEFSIDLNDMAWNGEFLKPTDLVDLTTDEAFEKGESSWNKERIFITSVRPDFRAGRAKIEATETKMYRKYGFIAPQTVTVDYDSSSPGEREYAFVADINDTLGTGNSGADYTWYQ